MKEFCSRRKSTGLSVLVPPLASVPRIFGFKPTLFTLWNSVFLPALHSWSIPEGVSLHWSLSLLVCKVELLVAAFCSNSQGGCDKGTPQNSRIWTEQGPLATENLLHLFFLLEALKAKGNFRTWGYFGPDADSWKPQKRMVTIWPRIFLASGVHDRWHW